MIGLNIVGRRSSVLAILGFAATVALFAAAAPKASAVTPTTGFTIDISPSPRLLDALDLKNDGGISSSTYYDVLYSESCDNPNLRIKARNKPAIMITNLTGDAITSFALEIENSAYKFGTGDVGDNFQNAIKNTMYTDPGVGITGSVDPNNNKILNVNFTGLTQGKVVVFNIDLDPADPNSFAYPDYRMVLFGAPLQGQNPTDPAVATITRASVPSSHELSFANACDIHGNAVTFDSTPQFANANVRPYLDSDKMEVTQLGIPEPGSATLVAVCLAGFGLLARRER